MTARRVIVGTQLAQSSVVAVALLRADVPYAGLLHHGAWVWAVAALGLAVWPIVLLACLRSRTAWSVAVVCWALTTTAVVARLQRWMTLETWLVAAVSLALAAAAAGVVWSGNLGDRAPTRD